MKVSELRDALRRRWPLSARIFFSLSLALAVGAIALMSSYRAQIERVRPDLGPPTAVVVAGRDLARGTVLSAADLRVRTLPRSVVPVAALGTVEAGAGRVLLAGMGGGEVLTAERLASRGAGAIAALVPPGLFAIGVPSDLPEGAVRAGDTVDVLATFGGVHAHTETSASGAQVLTVLAPGSGGSTDVGAPTGPRLMLLVDSSTASSLAYAMAFGHVAIAIDPPDVAGSPGAGLTPPIAGG